MDNKARFDQIEALLAELLRRADRQDEFNKYAAQQFERIDQQFERIDQRFERIDQRFERIDQRFDFLTDKLDGVVEVLKLSAEAHRQSEERQEQMLTQQERILRLLEQQGRRTDATQAEILRLMQKWDEQEARNQAVEKRLDVTDSHEPRIKRLEDDALRQAS